MNKMLLICTTLLFSAGAFAAGNDGRGCDNKSLIGAYSYTVSGVNEFPTPPRGNLVTQSTHVIGKVTFDGKGR